MRHAAHRLGLCLLASLAAPALAQAPTSGSAGSGPPLPQMVAPDAAGVDLLNGGRVVTDSAISIGAAGAPALELTEGGGGFGGTPLGGFHYTDGAYPYFSDFVVLGNRGASNTFGDGTARNFPDGMIGASNALTEGDGTRWNMAGSGSAKPNADRYLTTLVRPDGETLTYAYSSVPTGDIRGRLRSIRSSAGYQLNVEWEPTGKLKKVTLTNRRYAYCDPLNGTCTGSYAWPTMSWATDASGNTTATTSGLRGVVYGAPQIQGGSAWEWTQQITSGTGVSRTYTIRAGPYSWGMPLVYGRSSTSDPCPLAAAVQKVQEPTGTWNYAWQASCSGFSAATRTDPLGRTSGRNGGGFTDELGRTSTHTFINQWGSSVVPGGAITRTTSTTYPEGNKVTWDWGSPYGPQNLLSTTVTPKPSVGGSTLTWTRGYPSGCNVTTNINCNKPTHEIDSRGKRSDYTYDPVHGGLLTKTLPADDNGVRPQVRYTYQQYSAKVLNSSGALVNETPIWKLFSTSACRTQASCAGAADEVVTSYTYDDNLLVATETVRAGDYSASTTVAKTYDPVGNLVSVDGPAAGPDDSTRYVYDALRRLVATMGPDPDGAGNPLPVPVTRTTYNGDNKPILVETGSAADRSDAALAAMSVERKLVTTYDGSGRKASESLVAGGSARTLTQYSYDALARRECTAVRMNVAAFGALPASACSLGTQGSFGPDRITRNVYDWAGQVTTIQKAYGVTAANGFPATLQQNYAGYEYTANGRQKAVIDANGNRAELRYDGLDRHTCWIFPSKTTAGALGGDCSTGDFESYVYDPGGNRTTLRKRDGVSLTFLYDDLNRMKQKTVPASVTGAAGYSIFYGYDLRGLQTYARFGSAAGAGIASAYDSFGRLSSSTTNLDGTARTFSSQYDAAGNRTALASSAYSAAYDYDLLGRMTAYKEGATPVVQFVYDPNSRRLSLATGAASTSTLAYTYDPAGRLSGLTRQLAGTAADQNLTFGHNPASQIVDRTNSNDSYVSNSAYNVGRAYSVNGLNQYTGTLSNGATSASFDYDANGNLKSDGASSYVYDSENRLVSATGAKTASLAYDPLGRLWQTSGGAAGIIRFVYDGDRLVEEYDGAGNRLRVYVHGPGADEPLVLYELTGGPVHRFYHTDHQGSVVALADDNGTALAINGYDAWGIPNAANSGRFGYTGQAWIAELGMYYYKARIYSPTLGRFMQTDPVGYADQINLYAYVGNDPVNRGDPTGLYETSCASFDQRCNEAAQRFEAARQANLSSRDAAVAASARAFGNPGEANGVNVRFLGDREMNTTFDSTTKGSVGNLAYTGPRVTMDVSIRMSLRGQALRGTVAHEGTHVVQITALAGSYNATTGKYSAALNLTIRQAETRAFTVQNSVTNEFRFGSDIDRHVRDNYRARLDNHLLNPEYDE